eukprot:4613873-Prymnesium_polylepis.1
MDLDVMEQIIRAELPEMQNRKYDKSGEGSQDRPVREGAVSLSIADMFSGGAPDCAAHARPAASTT